MSWLAISLRRFVKLTASISKRALEPSGNSWEMLAGNQNEWRRSVKAECDLLRMKRVDHTQLKRNLQKRIISGVPGYLNWLVGSVKHVPYLGRLYMSSMSNLSELWLKKSDRNQILLKSWQRRETKPGPYDWKAEILATAPTTRLLLKTK